MNTQSFNRTQAQNILSPKYQVINTADVTERIENLGFTLRQVQEQAYKNKENKGLGKHLLRFQPANIATKQVNTPEIVLKNSYNGASSFELMLGFYRMVCANGLIVGTTFDSVKIRHVGDALSQVEQAVPLVLNQAQQATEQISQWEYHLLTESEQKQFARQALVDILQVNPMSVTDATLTQLLQCYRAGDAGNSIWLVFNRIQENLLRGRFKLIGPAKDGGLRVVKHRQVKSVDKTVDVNRKLWNLAAEIAA